MAAEIQRFGSEPSPALDAAMASMGFMKTALLPRSGLRLESNHDPEVEATADSLMQVRAACTGCPGPTAILLMPLAIFSHLKRLFAKHLAWSFLAIHACIESVELEIAIRS